jgi:homoserine kinase
VVINVPATTANLGPGFDSFGFALNVWNRVIVERADEFSITLEGEGMERLTADRTNIIPRMAEKALASLGQEMPPLRFICQNAVRYTARAAAPCPAGLWSATPLQYGEGSC